MTVPAAIVRKVGGRLEYAEPHEGRKRKPLPTWAWPGAYPIWYFDADCEVYCAKCADLPHVRITHADVAWEGPDEVCAECGAELETAYGDPDAEAGG